MKRILAKMAAVMAAVERVEKDAHNRNDGYRYASERAIKEALHPALLEAGIIFNIQVAGEPKLVSHGQFKSGTPNDVLYVPFQYRFLCVETGEELAGGFYGTGQGNKGDKSLYQAVTGAIKYILTSNFLIPTGDDPENDTAAPTKQAQPSANSGNSAAQDAEYVCSTSGCGVISKASEAPVIKSKRPPHPPGTLIFKCPSCDRWVPCMEAGGHVDEPGDDLPDGFAGSEPPAHTDADR